MGRTLTIPMGLAAVLYALYLPTYYVGKIHDDAVYIVASESLLRGSYLAPHLWPSHQLIQYPPGFSLFIALTLVSFLLLRRAAAGYRRRFFVLKALA